jgi:peptide deformylase
MGKEIEMSEFDLSIPPHGNDCLVPRMESILIYAGTTEEPDRGKHFKFTGLTARTVHHEIDHLTGTFFIDRVGDKRKRLVLEKYQNWKTKWEAAGRPFPY